METPAAMNPEPKFQSEYGSRQTDAAHRVLIDLAQVLAPFQDCLVLIGGWVPYLLLPDAQEPHVGSIDVDLALDAEKLYDGRYAEATQGSACHSPLPSWGETVSTHNRCRPRGRR